jgi:hypothetical protein
VIVLADTIDAGPFHKDEVVRMEGILSRFYVSTEMKRFEIYVTNANISKKWW